MKDDSVKREATREELEAMKRLLRDGLDAGGIGFSSSWAQTHNDADGRMVPSRYASRDEIIELCRVTGEFPGTGLEFIPQFGPFAPWAIEMMADMSVAAQRELNWNAMFPNAANLGECQQKLTAGDHARQKGGKVVALTVPMNFGMRFSFASGYVLDAIPGWESVMAMPRGDKLAALRDAAMRAHLNDVAHSPANPLQTLADWSDKVIFDVIAPENEQYRGRTVGDIAKEQGRDCWDVLCGIVIADELNTSFGVPLAPESDADWKARLEVWRDSRAVIGASDAGAHLDMLASFHYTTELLGKAVRQRQLLPLEEAVHLLTDVQGRLYGLTGRGRIAEGWFADLVVMDPITVGSHDLVMRFDLPAGAGRLYAEADGIDHVLVNGRPIVRDSRLTTERSGTLLRSGRDTETSPLD
jgi:N-acyl-D-aspartate/D-glutamate deacylase